jgi:hypothetical protein
VTGVTNLNYRILLVSLDGEFKSLAESQEREAFVLSIPSPDGKYLAYTSQWTEANVSLLENF